jgi:GNAT superfamily N-acetyltransferase
MQMESLFDVPATEKSRQEWHVRMPLDEQPWNVGLIVGPSGAGKSCVARAVFGDALLGEQEWSPDRSILDDFPTGMGIKEIVTLLSAVGFNSPPAWVRPFRVLSNGEQFRVSCARALADTDGLVAIDEFTSVVDRQVAQVASHTVQKTVRRAGRQLVAIACHYDIVEWLQPDWVYQPHSGEFTWRSVQPRPRVQLTLAAVDRAAWGAFRHHHYLSGELLTSARCFGAFIPDGRCVAFAAIRMLPHPRTKNIYMGHRLVVLPDWQGLGIGLAVDDWLGWWLYRRGYRYRNTVAHPTMIAAYSRSPRWDDVTMNIKAQERSRTSSAKAKPNLARNQVDPRRLLTRSFQYRPPREDPYH